MPAVKDLTDKRFGKLVVVSRDKSHPKGKGTFWCVRCDCGVEKVLPASNISRGHAKSCGCGIAESNRHRATHGLYRSRLYKIWSSAKRRCTNPNAEHYHRYGGRGITMHSAWVEDFAVFLRDVGDPPEPQLTLDRIDNNKGYEPGNMRWVGRKEQANNRSTNILLTWKGETMTMSQWAERLGCSYALLRGRWKAGRSDDDLFASAKWVRGKNRKKDIL